MRSVRASGPLTAAGHNATASGGTSCHSKLLVSYLATGNLACLHVTQEGAQQGATELSRYDATLVCCTLKPAEEQSCKPKAQVMHVLMLQSSLHCDTGDVSGQEWETCQSEMTRITCA